jgi:uncharacterized protein (DUF58 family)
MTTPHATRAEAESLAAHLPPLLAEAEHLAATVLLGEHGRRRAGVGDTFWQYRPAQMHDSARSIDWRRSARSDARFVQDREWQIAQSVVIWVDQGAAMGFASDGQPTKGARARVLALALASLLLRGGERVGLTGLRLPPRRGSGQLQQMAQLLADQAQDDHAAPDTAGILPQSRALFISDFLGQMPAIADAMTQAADRGVKGALVQVLDPQEEVFPFDGRTIFQSMTGKVSHETLRARDLKARYLDRLAARKDELAQLARRTGWQFHSHHTGQSAQAALLWLYGAMERRR